MDKRKREEMKPLSLSRLQTFYEHQPDLKKDN